MRAYIEDDKLHVVVYENGKRFSCGRSVEREHIFDKVWTAQIRSAFLREFFGEPDFLATAPKPESEALREDARILEEEE